MKPTRLFHTIVMVGVSLTAPAALATAVVMVPGCSTQLDGFPAIHPSDLAHFSMIDMAPFPTIQTPDLANFVIIDASFPTIEIDMSRRD